MFSGYKMILVTGGRDFSDGTRVSLVLEQALHDFRTICVLQGGAKGADKLAKDWALDRGVPCLTMDAPWDAFGKQAGIVRNKWMADICLPDMCLAFPGGTGTAQMKQYATQKSIPVYEV